MCWIRMGCMPVPVHVLDAHVLYITAAYKCWMNVCWIYACAGRVYVQDTCAASMHWIHIYADYIPAAYIRAAV